MTPEQAQALRAPFPEHMVGKLPKAGVQLDYVGHAAVTDRLLSVDPDWSWEPMTFTPEGDPRVIVADKECWFWIRLTVCGVTRPAVGTASRSAFDLPKQLISDALRNGAMRFGVALDLWAKEDLHEPKEQKPAKKAPAKKPLAGWESIEQQAARHKAFSELVKDAPEQVRAEWRAWREASGLEGWPLPFAQFDAVEQKFLELSNPVDPETEPF